MGLSRITFVSDGSTTLFAVNFALGYISQADVKCYVDGEVDGLGAQIYRAITFVTTNMMQISGVAPTVGTHITFDRTVNKTAFLVNFTNGDEFTEDNLTLMQQQCLMVIHEAIDGRIGPIVSDFSMGGFDVTNVGNLDAASITLNGNILTATPFAVADNSVSTVKLQALAVTAAKLAATALSDSIHSATAVSSALDGDEFGIWDVVTGLFRKVTWANIKATLLSTFLPLTGGTMTGNVVIAPATGGASVIINKPAPGSAANFTGQTGGLNRWGFSLGNSAAESGGNAGSDFVVNRYNDAGALLDQPLQISRATGLVTAVDGIATTTGTVSEQGQRVYSPNNHQPVLGEGQTWAASGKTAGTVYQNTGTRPIMVVVTWGGSAGGSIQTSPNNTTYLSLGGVGSGGIATSSQASAIIPAGHYYKVITSSGTISAWVELS